MSEKQDSGASEWVDPDDAPAMDAAFFDRAEIRHGDKVIRPGRPPLNLEAKQQITLRLDADVIAYFRSTGDGWQTRINAALRASASLNPADQARPSQLGL